MDLEEVATLAEALAGVRRKGTASRPAWYVDDRLVVRWLDETSVVIRSGIDQRELLLEHHPETFSVPPRFEAHRMIVVELPHADPDAVAAALRAAWALQRRPLSEHG